MYDFTKAVEEVIAQCKTIGKGKVVRIDQNGRNTLWLEAEWVPHPDGIHKVVELEICYSDTGRVAYGNIIEETMMPINEA